MSSHSGQERSVLQRVGDVHDSDHHEPESSSSSLSSKPILQLKPGGCDTLAKAPTSTATCRFCKRKISKNCFRIERVVPNKKHPEKLDKYMYHVWCVNDEYGMLDSKTHNLLRKETFERGNNNVILRTRKKLMSDLRQLRKDMLVQTQDYGYDFRNEYMVFPNCVLEQLVIKLPRNQHELLRINGIGARKVHLFGNEILLVIERFLEDTTGAETGMKSVMDKIG